VEWEDRALLQAEIDLQNTAFVDPATRVQKRWIDPDVFVEGTVTTGAGGSGAWSIRMRDAKTGAIVGGDDGSFPAGGDWFEAERQIADKLLDQICGGSYDVTLSLRTDAVFATHIASGTVNVTLTATGTRSKPKMPPTTFTASGPISYENLSFVSKMPECSYTAFTGTPGTWTVTLEITTAGRLKVSWQTGAGGPLATATVVCDKSSVPGQPGADLILPTPVTFELPVDGGQQAIGGGLTSGTDGWTHTGTMILKRRPK
jgi:hypothetical protein